MAGLVGFASCRSGVGRGGEVGCCPIKRLATQSLQPWILLFMLQGVGCMKLKSTFCKVILNYFVVVVVVFCSITGHCTRL